jgi:hypothetical protein
MRGKVRPRSARLERGEGATADSGPLGYHPGPNTEVISTPGVSRGFGRRDNQECHDELTHRSFTKRL